MLARGVEREMQLAEPHVVKFDAELRQIKSMADGTYNLVLNIPEYCLPQTQQRMAWLKGQVDVAVVYQPENDQDEPKRTKPRY